MSDTLSTGLSALQLSWDTPYRILASLLGIGCACAIFGWIAASTPLEALGHVGAYLGLPHSQEITGGLSRWLSGRKDAVAPVAVILMFLGLLANVGDGSGRNSIPGPWRGAPTALIALAVLWEVDRGSVPGLLLLVAAGLLAFYFIRRFSGKRTEVGSWLASTFVNLLASAVFVGVVVMWMIGRTSPKAPQ